MSRYIPHVHDVLPDQARRYIEERAREMLQDREHKLLTREEFEGLYTAWLFERNASLEHGVTRSFRMSTTTDEWTSPMSPAQVHDILRARYEHVRHSGGNAKAVDSNQTRFWESRILGRVECKRNQYGSLILNVAHLEDEFNDLDLDAETLARLGVS